MRDISFPALWRFRLLPDGAPSDTVNLTRTRDAAAAHALARLNGQKECGSGGPEDAAWPSLHPRAPACGRPMKNAEQTPTQARDAALTRLNSEESTPDGSEDAPPAGAPQPACSTASEEVARDTFRPAPTD